MDREEENKERSENFQPTIPLAREETVSDQSADNNPLEEERWFFKGISGKEAERTILEPENKEGSFLIRESRSNKGCYALLVKHWDPKLDVRVIHYKIFSSPSGYYINPRIKFISLQELVKYYHESNNTFIRVSVKVQNVELTPDDSFLREVSIRKALQHVCLVQLLGVMTRSQPMLIITEFMSQGNLKSYLRSDLGRQLELVLLIDFAIQVVDGMIYLEENCYVHRDLRSANILLSDTLECKIGDFSLTRKLKDHRYILLKGEKVAVKWTAPEVFKEESHTTKSDVWSFGIFLMELVTFGQTPYPGLTFAQTLDFLENGLRMQRPVRCTEELFCVMSMCWEENPWSRPSFKQLRDLLENL
ncbi:tyrosine-protein kinase HCK-like isoform X2 [Carcharodon carcharias]|uniref:tyrosine-protein kinase HCK-like isoform X2 n=1 Tax=Carcharodon carcharias TaxID=13397 RepID=UPI001B7E1B7A|nr:tyrosine-protein kinase HCK-like isoform X2 [Carcharodon carcharias]